VIEHNAHATFTSPSRRAIEAAEVYFGWNL